MAAANASTTGTDATVELSVQMAPTKYAVCIRVHLLSSVTVNKDSLVQSDI